MEADIGPLCLLRQAELASVDELPRERRSELTIVKRAVIAEEQGLLPIGEIEIDLVEHFVR